MERLKRSFRNSFRKRKSTSHQTESSKPHQWEGDEIAVRNGNCSFPVKYLGCVQVQDSRGMHICEQALLTLKAQKGKSIKGQLHVSGDGLRVVDDETKGLIVDQTIEKVSFCAPDRNHDRGFSYICRDGTTRRWMCHGFIATRDTGDRLSHAVGCSFTVCLERKQKRDAKLSEIKSNTNVTNTNSSLNSTSSSLISSLMNSTSTNFDNTRQQFNRTGSFRRLPLKQRMKDPQEAKLIDPLPIKEVHNPYAIERPHATPLLLERQGSCRIFKGLNQNSPFKRQLSLRFSTPNQIETHRNDLLKQQSHDKETFKKFDPSIENSLTTNYQSDIKSSNNSDRKSDLSAMCKYMTENLTMMSKKQDIFDNNFEPNHSKSLSTKADNESSILQTTMSDSLNNDSNLHTHKNIISEESSPILNQINHQMKFGQLTSYFDDFLTPLSMNNSRDFKNNSTSNGIMFTDLDEPFELNFDEKITKINLDQREQSLRIKSINSLNNSSMNSLSNSLTSSINGEIGNNSSINQVKMLNSLNQADELVKHMNIKDNSINISNQINSPFVNSIKNVNRKNNLTNLTNKNNIMNKKLNEFDPFNAEWVSFARNDDIGQNTTNPFLQNIPTTVKAFELKM